MPVRSGGHHRIDVRVTGGVPSSSKQFSWTSSPFKTSDFNRVILKTASEVENGFLGCYIEWQFTRDDEFEALARQQTTGCASRRRPDAYPPSSSTATHRGRTAVPGTALSVLATSSPPKAATLSDSRV